MQYAIKSQRKTKQKLFLSSPPCAGISSATIRKAQDAICNEIARNSKSQTGNNDQGSISNIQLKFQISNFKRIAED